MNAEGTFVFVYGTLKAGDYNNHLLMQNGAGFISNGLTPAIFDMVNLGGYPALITGHNEIVGEVWSVDEECLKVLDSLEVPYGYIRTTEKVTDLRTGTIYECTVYVATKKRELELKDAIKRSKLEIIDSGHWPVDREATIEKNEQENQA